VQNQSSFLLSHQTLITCSTIVEPVLYGVCRALYMMNLTQQARYLASNSGGSWFNSAFSYQVSSNGHEGGGSAEVAAAKADTQPTGMGFAAHSTVVRNGVLCTYNHLSSCI